MPQLLVAVRTFIFYWRKVFFLLPRVISILSVAGAAFQGLIACGGKIAVSFFESLVAVKICRLWR